jgi:hypothetical protein
VRMTAVATIASRRRSAEVIEERLEHDRAHIVSPGGLATFPLRELWGI